jgi:hypothetical protein
MESTIATVSQIDFSLPSYYIRTIARALGLGPSDNRNEHPQPAGSEQACVTYS